MKTRNKLLTIVAAAAVLLSGTWGYADHRDPEVIATVPVGRVALDPGVNALTNRIYVPNALSDTVSVIDGASNTVVATIPVPSPHRFVSADTTTLVVFPAKHLSDEA